ncbi:MAG TPA: ABC transporter ATP-binding protein [bacterium]|nr:ABC transporter ATP-binding protein [bacterium]
MPVIEVKNVVKTYSGINAVDGISFTVNEGEIFGLLGPNGAGKTTTVEMIEGLRPIDSGQATLLGFDVSKQAGDVAESIGVQLQSTAVNDRLTVQETLELFASFYEHKTDVHKLITSLNLDEKQHTLAMNLSGGQKQRLAIALALVNDPLVVFLDEPTTGLDPQARRSLWEVIKQIKANNKTVMMTTHYMEEAEELCDRVAIMDHGKILDLAHPQELITKYFKEKTIELELANGSQKHVQFCTAIPGVESCHQEENSLTLYTTDSQGVLTALLATAKEKQIVFKDLRIRSATLEDVFIKLTGSKIRE